MWKIYDVTNGYRHLLCNDISTARRTLLAERRMFESLREEHGECAPDIVDSKRGFTVCDAFVDDEPYDWLIEEVSVWNTVPDELKQYAEVNDREGAPVNEVDYGYVSDGKWVDG